jgi:hypothetical protein
MNVLYDEGLQASGLGSAFLLPVTYNAQNEGLLHLGFNVPFIQILVIFSLIFAK